MYVSCHLIYLQCLQSDLRNKEARNIDLQNNVKSQQEEATKTKEELTKALAAMEKLKESFNKDRAEWEIEKSGLIKSAEDAKAALKPVVEELAGLKRQINAMTSAIFGKCVLYVFGITCGTLSLTRMLMLNRDRHPDCSSWYRYADEAQSGIYIG